MVALGFLAQATLGSSTAVDGLACLPTTPASMQVTVGPGSIASFQTVDATSFGSLPADTTDPLVKMGVMATATTFTLTAPATSGQSINYLIEAAFSETDASSVVLPYYNASNPSQPYSGPSNSGTAQDTQRIQRVALQLKPGTPAAAGTQATPAVDSGYVGLYVITVNYGQVTVTTGSIATIPTAPFVPYKLPQLAPGFSRVQVFNSSGTFTVPAGVTLVKVRLVGGGGGGGGGDPAHCGSGGGAGGYSEGVFSVTQGSALSITVGAGGVSNSGDNPAAGGGTSQVASLGISATGGGGGTAGAGAYNPGAAGGVGSGGYLNCLGGYGTDGFYYGSGSSQIGGFGGASFFGGGGRAATNGSSLAAMNGQAPGSGGGGAYENSGTATGGAGANGIVIMEC